MSAGTIQDLQLQPNVVGKSVHVCNCRHSIKAADSVLKLQMSAVQSLLLKLQTGQPFPNANDRIEVAKLLVVFGVWKHRAVTSDPCVWSLADARTYRCRHSEAVSSLQGCRGQTAVRFCLCCRKSKFVATTCTFTDAKLYLQVQTCNLRPQIFAAAAVD